MTNFIDDVNGIIHQRIAAEIERRAVEWLTAAKGGDWTRAFQDTLLQNAQLKEKNRDLEDKWQMLKSVTSVEALVSVSAAPRSRKRVGGHEDRTQRREAQGLEVVLSRMRSWATR